MTRLRNSMFFTHSNNSIHILLYTFLHNACKHCSSSPFFKEFCFEMGLRVGMVIRWEIWFGVRLDFWTRRGLSCTSQWIWLFEVSSMWAQIVLMGLCWQKAPSSLDCWAWLGEIFFKRKMMRWDLLLLLLLLLFYGIRYLAKKS